MTTQLALTAQPALTALLQRPAVTALLAAFHGAGAEARIVGGAVRDAIMDRPIGDIDMATPMLPEATMALARQHGWKAVPTGLAHGTITIIIDGQPTEITTLRRDVETDGRHAIVSFTDDYREDAFRRDFTLNALSLSANGVVHDYATGVADAQAGRIRFMGAPEQRVREDYLRILRFFRFQASHGRGAPDPAGLTACATLKEGMARLSRERVRQELLKLIVAHGAANAVRSMTGIGLWEHVLARFDVAEDVFVRWTALQDKLSPQPEPMGALAALVREGTDAEELAASLRLSRQETATYHAITAHARACASVNPLRDDVRRAVYLAGEEHFQGALDVGAAWTGVDVSTVRSIRAAATDMLAAPPRLPFKSADVAALGVSPGPRMGTVLAQAERQWLDAGLPDDPAALADILRHAVETTTD